MTKSVIYSLSILGILIMRFSSAYCDDRSEFQRITNEELTTRVENAMDEHMHSTKGLGVLPFIIYKMKHFYHERYLNENAKRDELGSEGELFLGAITGAGLVVFGNKLIDNSRHYSKVQSRVGTVAILSGAALSTLAIWKGYHNKKVVAKIDEALEGSSYRILFQQVVQRQDREQEIFNRVKRGIRQNYGLEKLIQMGDEEKGREFSRYFEIERKFLSREFEALEMERDEKTQLINEIAAEIALLRLFSKGSTERRVVLEVEELISRVMQKIRIKLDTQKINEIRQGDTHSKNNSEEASVHNGRKE